MYHIDHVSANGVIVRMFRISVGHEQSINNVTVLENDKLVYKLQLT